MIAGSGWFWMTSNLFGFIEGQTHFNTSWHAWMGWTLNKPLPNVLHSILQAHYVQADTKKVPNMEVLYAKQPIPNQKSYWVRG